MDAVGIEAALFDWSGTLVDDLDAVWRTNDLTLMSFGLPHQDLNTFKDKFILPWQDFYSLYGLGTPEKLAEVDRRFWDMYRDISASIKPFPETRSILARLKAGGIRVAVVTQTKRGPLKEQILRFGLRDLIDAEVGAEDADELKPSPKPVLAALDRLGTLPGRAIFTGDMLEDVQAGNRAGVRVVSLIRNGSYQTEERVKAGRPFRIAHSLAEVADVVLGLR